MIFCLVDLFVGLVAAHLADSVFEHGVLLIKMINGLLAFGVVVHGRLEEEREEALDAETTGTGGQIAEQTEVETQRCCQD